MAGGQEDRAELRAQVLDAATSAFLKKPFEEVRVEDIASEAGVAKGLVFYYFKNKRGLYLAVIQSLMGSLVATTAPDPSLPLKQRQLAAVQTFVDWAQETEGIEIILRTWSAGDREIDAALRMAAELIIGQMMAAMTDMPRGPGSADAVPEQIMSRAIWGWLAFARIVVADWLVSRDLTSEELRDFLAEVLDGVVVAARSFGQPGD
jgi:AcrR family transcriptional regulator